LDDDEIYTAVEKDAELFELEFFKILNPDLPIFDFEIN
jgi:hypothetical protein